LQSVKFEASDLSGSYLGEAAGGNRILVDRDAAAKAGSSMRIRRQT